MICGRSNLFAEFNYREPIVYTEKETESKEAASFQMPKGIDADQLVDYLSRTNSMLAKLYAKSSGVDEGYTVGEHTKMVLIVAAKYKTTFEGMVTKLVSWDEFLLFLALHDIGKGDAKEKESVDFGSSHSFKSSELKHTQELLAQFMAKYGLPAAKISLFKEMLRYDTQGLYLKLEISQQEAFDHLLEMARNCGTDPIQYYELFQAFHAIDAASYPALEYLFPVNDGKLTHIEENQQLIDTLVLQLKQVPLGYTYMLELKQHVKAGEAQKARDCFLKHHMELKQYLFSAHKEMLSLTFIPHASWGKFREVKKIFRDFLLLIASSSQDIAQIKCQYSEEIMKSFARNQDTIGFRFHRIFFRDFLDYDNTGEIAQFFDELAHFRKDYLCRYSINKVMNCAWQQMVMLGMGPFQEFCRVSGCTEFSWSPRVLSLLTTTFMHGSNAGMLPNFLRTGMQLMPVGRLLKANITPFSGEVSRGATKGGRNHYWISGTSLDYGHKAMNYAMSAQFQVKSNEEEKELVEFLIAREETIKQGRSLFSYVSSACQGDALNKMAIYISRWRTLKPKTFEPLRQRLLNVSNTYDKDFQKFKKTEDYKKHMPQSLDPDKTLGYQYHEDYYFEYFKATEGAIEKLNKSLTSPVVAPDGIQEAIADPFPFMFASNRVHPLTIDLTTGWERMAQRSCDIDHDITMIFTQSEKDRERFATLMEKQNRGKQLAYYDFKEVRSAMGLNWLASPYFADIASWKKLSRLTQKIEPKQMVQSTLTSEPTQAVELTQAVEPKQTDAPTQTGQPEQTGDHKPIAEKHE